MKPKELRAALFILALVLVPLAVMAENQISLGELGYKGFEVSGSGKKACSEFVFSIPEPAEESYPIISVKAIFFPKKEGEASVSIYLNNALLKKFTTPEFKCTKNECWARLKLAREQIKKENTLKVCARTGQSITRIKISNDSLIGYYKMPLFRKEGFRKCISLKNNKCVESYKATTGEDLNITIFLTNYGSALSAVDINNKSIEAGARPSRREIGQTSFSGIAYPKQTIAISYTVRVEKAIPMSLPPAIAVYRNAFGETETLYSNSVFIYPKKEAELTSTIGIESVDQQKKEAVLSLTIFNREKAPLYGINALLESAKGLELIDGNSKIEIKKLEARQAYTRIFRVKASKPGDYMIGCTYTGKGLTEKECKKARLTFRKENPATIIESIFILSAIAIAIYFYITTREEYHG